MKTLVTLTLFAITGLTDTAFARPDGYTVSIKAATSQGIPKTFDTFDCSYPTQQELDRYCEEKALKDCKIDRVIKHDCNPQKQLCYC